MYLVKRDGIVTETLRGATEIAKRTTFSDRCDAYAGFAPKDVLAEGVFTVGCDEHSAQFVIEAYEGFKVAKRKIVEVAVLTDEDIFGESDEDEDEDYFADDEGEDDEDEDSWNDEYDEDEDEYDDWDDDDEDEDEDDEYEDDEYEDDENEDENEDS